MSAALDGVVLRREEPLRRHLAWRTGGPCDAWLVVHRRASLNAALSLCRREGWRVNWIGAGTRTVGRDGGLSGALLRLGTDFSHLCTEASGLWRVGAAVPMPALAHALAQRTPATSTPVRVPIPSASGSVGASLVLDEGWQPCVREVVVAYRRGERALSWEEFAAVRSKRLVLEVVLDPETAPPKRSSRRRPHSPSAWFAPLSGRRSLRQIVARSSLTGTRLRGVAVASSEPEALVNLGGGRGADLLLLQQSIVDRIRRDQGITLDPQPIWLGSGR